MNGFPTAVYEVCSRNAATYGEMEMKISSKMPEEQTKH